MSGRYVMPDGDDVQIDLASTCPADDVCWVLTTSNPPFIIRAASPMWHKTWGWHAQEIIGKASTAILDGPGADTIASDAMMHDFFRGPERRASARLTNLTKGGAELRVHDFLLVKHPAGLLGISQNVRPADLASAATAPIHWEEPLVQSVLRDATRACSEKLQTSLVPPSIRRIKDEECIAGPGVSRESASQYPGDTRSRHPRVLSHGRRHKCGPRRSSRATGGSISNSSTEGSVAASSDDEPDGPSVPPLSPTATGQPVRFGI